MIVRLFRGPAMRAAAATLLLACAASPQASLLRLEKNASAMGAVFSVILYGTDPTAMEAAADATLEEAHRLDDLLSNYRPASEWSVVNREASARPVKVSPELFQLLKDCLAYSRASDGAFDITVGPLMKVWGFYKGTGHLPNPDDVTAALSKVGYQHIRLDDAAQTVRFDRPGIEIDPGGIGKGYAVDLMVAILRQHGVERALVDGSGSSIYGLGSPPEEPRGWTINIKEPGKPNHYASQVYLKDMSLSTSGSYEKFFRADGRTYAHIMDPHTGYPAQGSAAVSVVAPRTIDSEAWAKPYFINGRQWTSGHLPAGVRVFFCEDRAESPCSWLPQAPASEK